MPQEPNIFPSVGANCHSPNDNSPIYKGQLLLTPTQWLNNSTILNTNNYDTRTQHIPLYSPPPARWGGSMETTGGGRKVIYFNYDEDKRYKTTK